MTADERVALIQLKTERAKHHFADLEKMIRALYDSKLYAFTTERDPQTRCPLYRLTKLPDVDPQLSIVAGDVVQNLRTALDHLVQHLYLVANPGSSTNRSVSFFIGREHTATDYEATLRAKVQGLRPDAIKDLIEIEAYKSGKGHRLWVLNELNNVDKHRLLLVIDVHPPRFNAGEYLVRSMQELINANPRWPHDSVLPKIDLFINPATSVPLQLGDVIHTGAPDAELEKQIKFSPVIAFSESKVCEGQPILEVLHETTQLVGGLIGAFRDHLA